MLAPHRQLTSLEQTALGKIREVALQTPMRQVGEVLDVLLDVPTALRHADTPFSNQALAALQTLRAEIQSLCMAVDTLAEHVNRPAARAYPGVAVPSLLCTAIG